MPKDPPGTISSTSFRRDLNIIHYGTQIINANKSLGFAVTGWYIFNNMHHPHVQSEVKKTFQYTLETLKARGETLGNFKVDGEEN